MWSWVILVGLSVALGAAAHSVLRKQPVNAGFLAGCAAPAVLLLLARVQLGYFDPFWPIALFVMLLVAMPIAFAVVYALRYLDRRRAKSSVDKGLS